MTFNEHQFYYLLDPKKVGSETEAHREAVRMEIPMPPDHGEEGDAPPVSEQPNKNIRQDVTETLPISTFPKYYVSRYQDFSLSDDVICNSSL